MFSKLTCNNCEKHVQSPKETTVWQTRKIEGPKRPRKISSLVQLSKGSFTRRFSTFVTADFKHKYTFSTLQVCRCSGTVASLGNQCCPDLVSCSSSGEMKVSCFTVAASGPPLEHGLGRPENHHCRCGSTGHSSISISAIWVDGARV